MTAGAELFCRYAQPPNLLGYCGPDDNVGVTAVAGGLAVPIEEVARIATSFHGAWPYLELIGRFSGRDPLSTEVVAAYWTGNSLLEEVPLHYWGHSASDRFRKQAEQRWESVESALNEGGLPNHAFHVFCVYPWVGMLKQGFVGPSLEVLDRCRISWGKVEAVDEIVAVSRRPLAWINDELRPGEVKTEPFRPSPGVVLSPGDIVALHWDFVCDRLSTHDLRRLQSVHDHHLAIANRELTAGRLEPAR